VTIGGPVVIILVAVLGAPVGRWYAAGGWNLFLGLVIAFHFTFVAVGLMLSLAYRGIGSVVIGLRAVFVGAFFASSMIAGFAQGFLVFLAIPLDWSAPFGNLTSLGPIVALSLWAYILHLIVLIGYRIALVADAPKTPPAWRTHKIHFTFTALQRRVFL
jgi:membrane protein